MRMRVGRWIGGWMLAAGVAAAQATGGGPGEAGPPAGGEGPTALQRATLRDGRVMVYVALEQAPAVAEYLAAREAAAGEGKAAAEAKGTAASKAALARNTQTQADWIGYLKRAGVRFDELFRLQRTGNGIALMVEPEDIVFLRGLKGVRAVEPLPPAEFAEVNAFDRFVGATALRNLTGLTGAGLKVAVVDSGIDYYHVAFGGPGAGFDQADGRTTTDTVGLFPGPVVAGGYDLVGEGFLNGDVPQPDPDPLDDQGHGTAVTSVLAGRGVLANGQGYSGPYTWAENARPDFRIPPGIAPGVKIYMYRVGGRDNLAPLAPAGIERAIDPDQNGDYSDKPDVINLSIGRDYGYAEYPESVASDFASRLGVIVVSAAGNTGNSFYVMSAPGMARTVLCAAAGHADGDIVHQLEVTAPLNQAASYNVAMQDYGAAPPAEGLNGTLIAAEPFTACSDWTNTAAMQGKIVLLRGAADCTAKATSEALEAAGAIGIVYALDPNWDRELSIGGTSQFERTIPIGVMRAADGAALYAQVGGGTLQVRLGSNPAAFPANGGGIANYSSRGPGRGGALPKPDVMTPGDGITGPAMGTGNGVRINGGTSLASPALAGAAALMREIHPAWLYWEIKALLINTASGASRLLPEDPTPLPPTRAGSGRLDLMQAQASQAIAYDRDDPELVGVTFGLVEVVDSYTADRTVRIANKGTTALTLGKGATVLSEVPGVTISFPGAASVNVPAGQTRDVTVRLSCPDAAALKYPLPPGVPPQQSGFQRFHQAELSGNLTFTPSNGDPALRVPFVAVVRRASAMQAVGDVRHIPQNGAQSVTLQGTGFAEFANPPQDVAALAWPFELLYDAPNPPAGLPADKVWKTIRAVGVRTYDFNVPNFADRSIYFGIAAHGDWETTHDVYYSVRIDRNGDGVEDARVTNNDSTLGRDIAQVYVQNPVGTYAATTWWLNDLAPQVTPTYIWNTNVMVLRATAEQLGLTEANSRFSFRVDVLIPDDRNTVIDSTGFMTYEVARPGLAFGANLYWYDTPGNLMDWTANADNLRGNRGLGAMIFHLHNARGTRVQMLPMNTGVGEGWRGYW